MSDQDRAREREHWQAIAEQLGLAPETEMREASPAMPAAPVAEGAAASQTVAPREPEPQLESLPVTDLVEPAEQSVAHLEQPTQEAPEFPSAERVGTEETPEPRGRRRRRSTPRSDKARTGEPSEAGSVENREPSSKRRDKGRGRKKQAHARAEDETEVAAASTTAPDDADDDEGYGNWTVPSWSELIASLYRPER